METLKDYLSKTGESQSAFALRVGASKSFISEIVSGRKRPSLDLALAIAAATSGEVPVDSWAAKNTPDGAA